VICEALPASAALQVPDTVTAGSLFDVTVRTHGNSCVQAVGGEARVAGLVATVTPYGMVSRGFCADIQTAPTRVAPVRVDARGAAAGAGAMLDTSINVT
jgi:hypothetical protein